MPQLAVIISCPARSATLPELLAALRRQTIADELQIFVVSSEAIAGAPEREITFVPAVPGFGSAAAFNAGWRAARAAGDFAGSLLLTDGTTLAPDCAAQLQRALAARPRAGVAAAKVYYAHDRELIFEAGVLHEPALGARLRRFHRRWDDGTFVDTVEVDAADAGAMLLTRAAWDAIGGMDEGYCSAWGLADACARLQQAGLTAIVAPPACCWLADEAADDHDTSRYYYEWRDRLRFWRRWALAGDWPGIVRAAGAEAARLCAVARHTGRAAIADTLLAALRDAAAGVAGIAPDGRIRTLTAPAEDEPEMCGPVALLDWPGGEEARYQALFRVTEILRRRLPGAEIRFVAARPSEPDVALLLKRRGIIVSTQGEIEAASIVALCEHSWFIRDNALAATLPPECLLWADGQGNVVPATVPALTPAEDADLDVALAALRAAPR